MSRIPSASGEGDDGHTTGVGGSGTSFFAELAFHLRFDLGEHWVKGYGTGMLFDGRTGGEDALCNQINLALLRGETVPKGVMRTVAVCRQVVKHPSFMRTVGLWADAGAQIDQVVVPIRDLTDAARSFADRGFEREGETPETFIEDARASLGALWEACVTRQINAVAVPFPAYLAYPERVYPLLPWVHPHVTPERFCAVWRKVARPGQLKPWERRQGAQDGAQEIRAARFWRRAYVVGEAQEAQAGSVEIADRNPAAKGGNGVHKIED